MYTSSSAQINFIVVNCNIATTIRYLGEWKKKETRGKDQIPGKQTAQKRRVHKERGKGTTKYRNFHQLQLLEAYQLKKGEVNPIKKKLQA